MSQCASGSRNERACKLWYARVLLCAVGLVWCAAMCDTDADDDSCLTDADDAVPAQINPK